MGVIYTFYSYKGGVGRSMALANVAALLAKWGKSVLVIDWDLEAPGLEKYFQNEPSRIEGSRKETPGLVDIVRAFAKGRPLDWRECLLTAYPDGKDESFSVSILSAGKDVPEYVERAQSLDWLTLVNKQGLGLYLEELREEWLGQFEFVLIDSRTGMTDIGGICTIHLPDALVLLFTANEQSLDGVRDVMRSARESYANLPYDRHPRLHGLPVPGRFERTAESDTADKWLGRFAADLAHVYEEWLPRGTTPAAALEKLYIPNIPKWSYGENLPVVRQGIDDPRTIGYAYAMLARLLKNHLQWDTALREMGAATADERSPDAVNAEADAALAALEGEGERETARRVLVSLVLPAPRGEGQDTRRRAPLGEFDEEERRVIDKLAASRLLKKETEKVVIVSGDGPMQTEQTGPTVEIAYDSTLRHWGQLRAWIDGARDFLLWRQQLRAGMDVWEKNGQRAQDLLSGTNLTTAEGFLETHGDELKAREKRYVVASTAEAERVTLEAERARFVEEQLKREEAERAAREEELKRHREEAERLRLKIEEEAERLRRLEAERAARLRRMIATFLLSAAVLLAGYLGFAYYRRRQEEAERQRQQQQALQQAEQATNKGQALAAAGQFGEAVDAYTQAIELKPDYAPAYLNRGIAYKNQQQNYNAMVDFNKVVALTAASKDQSYYDARTYIEQMEQLIEPVEDTASDRTPTADLPRRVYVQIQRGVSDTRAKEVAALLQKDGFVIVRTNYVAAAPDATQVRYYRLADDPDATRIVKLLRDQGMSGAQPRYIIGYENATNIRPRHYEIWFSNEDLGNTGAPR